MVSMSVPRNSWKHYLDGCSEDFKKIAFGKSLWYEIIGLIVNNRIESNRVNSAMKFPLNVNVWRGAPVNEEKLEWWNS